MWVLVGVLFVATVLFVKFIRPRTKPQFQELHLNNNSRFGMDTRKEKLHLEYDYIIVGGGSAGCTLAARLAEDEDVTVLLLESGGTDDLSVVKIPLRGHELQLSTMDWQFKTEKLSHMNDRVVFLPRGKILGGSSSINAMIWVRGDPENFNAWERAGCKGWSYEDVLPYFKKCENCEVPQTEDKWRGRDGPITITPAAGGRPSNVTEKFVIAAEQVGYPANPDYNGEKMEGVSVAQTNVSAGVREGAGQEYIRKLSSNRPNLTIALLTHVTRINFSGTTATGVAVRQGSVDFNELKKLPEFNIYARKEVILCAGAINTPWLLMLSGIGPAKHLDKLRVPVVADLSGVGRNFQDHILSPLLFKYNAETYHASLLFGLKAVTQYLMTKTGPLAAAGAEGIFFANTGVSDNKAVDFEIQFVPGIFGDQNNLKGWNLSPENGTQFDVSRLPRFGILFLAALLQPDSVGKLKLRSKDPFVYPKIDANYLSNEKDVAVLTEGIKICRKIARAQVHTTLVGEEIIDTRSTFPHDSDEYIAEYLRNTCVTNHHPVGTAKMGPRNDPTAVVDERLRVHGINRLRVVDASIMPKIVSANTNAAVFMIAEKAADLIKEDRRNGMKEAKL